MLEIIVELAAAEKVTNFFLMLLFCTFDCDARERDRVGSEAAAPWGRGL